MSKEKEVIEIVSKLSYDTSDLDIAIEKVKELTFLLEKIDGSNANSSISMSGVGVCKEVDSMRVVKTCADLYVSKINELLNSFEAETGKKMRLVEEEIRLTDCQPSIYRYKAEIKL